MKWDDIDSQTCSIARTLSVVGDRWTLLIVRDAFLGTKRFDEFQKQLEISRHRLSDRLQKLVADGVLEKVPYQDNPPRFDYRLTEKGLGLFPILMMLAQWGNRWEKDGNGDPVEYLHQTCGATVPADLTCASCGEVLNPRDVTAVPGPGLLSALTQSGDLDKAASDQRIPPMLRKAIADLS